jgi:hypothetical protein
MAQLRRRIEHLEAQRGTCATHHTPLVCQRCSRFEALTDEQAGLLGALFLRIGCEAFTPAPRHPRCPRCHGIRLCPLCNGQRCLTAAETAQMVGLLERMRHGPSSAAN